MTLDDRLLFIGNDVFLFLAVRHRYNRIVVLKLSLTKLAVDQNCMRHSRGYFLQEVGKIEYTFNKKGCFSCLGPLSARRIVAIKQYFGALPSEQGYWVRNFIDNYAIILITLID
jgi:hypothetical protein